MTVMLFMVAANTDVQFHFLRELIKAGEVKMVYCDTKE